MRPLLIKFIHLTFAALCFNCEPAIKPVRKFRIPKGEHYASERSVEALQSSIISFNARFNESAIYDLGDLALQSNKNKLLGFSDCNSLHHENSARFAWQWLNNRLEIYAYCYVDSERIEKYVGSVELNSFSRFRIEVTSVAYIFSLNAEPSVTIQRGSVCDRGLYYMLWPYFGGSVPAPHDIDIEITMF